MFFDMGAFELLTLVVLGVLVFGPDKLPKVIQDVMGFIRKVRAFSDNAKEDIRKELGPEFKDFDFQDLNPQTFVRKNLLENDEFGLKEIRNGFDLKELTADLSSTSLVKDTGSDAASHPSSAPELRKRDRLDPGERPPYDADAT